MSIVIEGHEVSVKIEEYGRPIMVGQDAIEVLRAEANRQANSWLCDLTAEINHSISFYAAREDH